MSGRVERICWIVLLVLFGYFFLYLFLIKVPEEDAERAIRQKELDAFYVRNNCKPYGYVATRYEPIRTYKCDNGIFIAKDMK